MNVSGSLNSMELPWDPALLEAGGDSLLTDSFSPTMPLQMPHRHPALVAATSPAVAEAVLGGPVAQVQPRSDIVIHSKR